MDALSGLFDIIKMIGDFLSSIIHGLKVIIETLGIVVGINSTSSIWMPSFIFGIFTTGVLLVVVLRVVK